MKKYSLSEHFLELKNRLMKIVVFFIISFMVAYYFKENLFQFLLQPLVDLSTGSTRKIIYTGLAEAFFSYIKLATFFAFFAVFPVICYQLYFFIAPGLLNYEKKIAASMMVLSPILFYIGSFFVFYFVMPKAWEFFLSYEQNSIELPLIMEARISEYLSLVLQLMFAFGMAFQLPVIMILLCVIGLVTPGFLVANRRISIVIIFLFAAIFTPPDIISQIALAIPLVLLYELSIMLCKLVKN